MNLDASKNLWQFIDGMTKIIKKKKISNYAYEISRWLKLNDDKLKSEGFSTFKLKLFFYKLRLKSLLNFLGM